MVHAVLLGAELLAVVGEGERVGGDVNLGDDVHAHLGGIFLELTELVLAVAAVLGGEFGEELALEAEGGVGLVPVITKVLLETVVVEVYLDGVHLVVGHGLGEGLEVVHGDELAGAVEQQAAQGVVGPVADGTLGQVCALVLLKDLQQGACSPIGSGGGVGLDGYAVVNLDAVTLVAQFLVVGEGHDDSPLGSLAGVLGLHCLAEEQAIVLGHSLGCIGELGIDIYHLGAGADGYHTIGTLPLAQFGDYKGLVVLGFQCRSHSQAE